MYLNIRKSIQSNIRKSIQYLKKILTKFNIYFTRYSSYKELEKLAFENADASIDLNFIKNIKSQNFNLLLENFEKSKSQIKQDLFVLEKTNYKREGFFVEFGATNGITGSNSYLLEKEFNWKGILSEPAKIWHDELNKNREVFIEKKCIYSESNMKLLFNQVQYAELSTIDQFSDNDNHSRGRQLSTDKYFVETISLEDLLEKYKAPKIIDYLSIDTEGSEYKILKNHNFEKYKFKIITCEHNFTNDRNLIHKLLTENGYERHYENISYFDDWYILIE